eukprot:scaffold286661_cov26-Tisochrysis_lutea.AAC.2
MLAPLTLTPIVVRWRAPPDVSANAAELSSKGMPSLTSPTVRSRVTSRPPMPEGNVADHVMSESPRSGHDSVNVRLMRRVPASLPGFIRTASSSLAQRQWTAARRTGSSDSTSTASSATTRGTLIATKSVKWLHRQPTLSIVALSTTVSHPSVLHPSSSSSQKRHSSAASQLLYPAFIRSKSSRCDGWPMQFRSASPVLVTGRARMIGSSSNCVIFVSLAKMEKETAGPARLSDRLSEPPCTFRVTTLRLLCDTLRQLDGRVGGTAGVKGERRSVRALHGNTERRRHHRDGAGGLLCLGKQRLEHKGDGLADFLACLHGVLRSGRRIFICGRIQHAANALHRALNDRVAYAASAVVLQENNLVDFPQALSDPLVVGKRRGRHGRRRWQRERWRWHGRSRARRLRGRQRRPTPERGGRRERRRCERHNGRQIGFDHLGRRDGRNGDA